jgi:hypothetical protein
MLTYIPALALFLLIWKVWFVSPVTVEIIVTGEAIFMPVRHHAC